MGFHKNIGAGDNHIIHSFIYATAAARAAAVHVVGDVGKVAWQQDQNSFWILVSTPSTWIELSNEATSPQNHEALTGLLGGGANDHQHLTTAQMLVLPSVGEKAALAGTAGLPASDNKFVTGNDSRLTDARAPTGHAVSHLTGGGDAIATATPSTSGLMSATDKAKLDELCYLIQTLFVEATTDRSTTSTTWVDLLSQSITLLAGTKLIALISASAVNTNDEFSYFRLVIDGVAQRGVSLRSRSDVAQPIALNFAKTGLAAGAHVVKLQWRVAASTSRIRPATQPDSEHASLLLQEVKV
jgi:hypothetical protein